MNRDLSALTVDQQLDYLAKGSVDLIERAELKARLQRGKPLTVKVGFDPTAPDIHLGHTVLIRKMKHFQQLGHRVVFVIGDFTGMIGDPTGKKVTRPALSREEILRNAETYKRQIFKILDPAKTETRFNAEWLSPLGAEGMIRLAAKYTLARMLERDDFRKRYTSQQPIALHELLYPLAQGYDSVALQADVELGGTDQLFNLLVGRDLMREYNLEPQMVLTTPLLEGLDGVEKMSKSLGNYIGIDEPPGEIYGKVMSISDELMWRYFTLCTDLTTEEIEKRKQGHPMEAKRELGRLIVEDFWGGEAAEGAEAEFRRVFSERQKPADIEEKKLPPSSEPVQIVRIMTAVGAAGGGNEARRLIAQGGVSVDDRRVEDGRQALDGREGQSYLLKIGKRRFVRVTFGS